MKTLVSCSVGRTRVFNLNIEDILVFSVKTKLPPLTMSSNEVSSVVCYERLAWSEMGCVLLMEQLGYFP
jgi:hypothetical protein